MYLEHYNLTEKPFQISTNPRFLWFGEKHKEAFSVLKYGVLDNKGFLLLTGEVGTGKTTLINALLKSLGDNMIVATVYNPNLNKMDFFNYVAHALDIQKKYQNKADFLIDVSKYLSDAYDNHKRVLLIIDEAQKLSRTLLEEIRLLSNIEKQDSKLINIFFIGQKEFNNILLEKENRALRQRITINYDLKPLSRKEIQAYISYRLQVAGTEREIFKPDAIREIMKFSKGYPRLINIVCDHALLTGFVKEVDTINSSVIKECIKELKIPEAKIKKGKKPAKIHTEDKQHLESGRGEKVLLNRKLFLFFLLTLFLAVLHFTYHPMTQTWYISDTDTRTEPDTLITARTIRKPIPADHPAVAPDFPDEPVKTGASLKIPIETDSSPLVTDTSDSFEELMKLKDKKVMLYFKHNSNELTNDAYNDLDRFAGILNQHPHVDIRITGYTDSTGSVSYNKKLSEFRANIVKGFLVGKGINPSRITSIGKGVFEQANADNPGDQIISDRRVELEITE